MAEIEWRGSTTSAAGFVGGINLFYYGPQSHRDGLNVYLRCNLPGMPGEENLATVSQALNRANELLQDFVARIGAVYL